MLRRIIADGCKGTDQTVYQVARLVIEGLLDPRVIQTARRLVVNIPDRDADAEIATVSDFVRAKMRYTREAVETLSTHGELIDEIRIFGRVFGDHA